ncbi:MAG: TonB-dependent receptor [Acidobacteria bacterium]|nr:TonB-dependent receptor [Acidobacteriota bacterium]
MTRLFVIACLCLPLAAQDETEEKKQEQPTYVEELVVTAQRREQSIQDVPLAVSAFKAETLEQMGTQTINELQMHVPNVTLVPSRATNNTLTAYVRGIGQADPLWGFEPGVGVYVDDVYIARPQGAMLEVFDVDRIEILRGPQGTLYGRNTIGGALKYVTKAYDPTPGGKIKAALGNYTQTDLVVSGHTPLGSDALIIGGSVAVLQRDGFGNYLPSGEENYNKDMLTGRLSLEYRPSDSFFLRLALDELRDDSNSKQGYRVTPEDPNDPSSQQVWDDIYDSYAGIGHENSVETSGQSLMMQWIINDQYSFKSITAHRDGHTDTPIDFDSLEEPYFDVPAFYDDDQLTQEFQLQFDGDHIHGIAGLYYLDGDASGAFDVVLSQVAGGFTILQAGDVETKSFAAFADVTWEWNDQWSMVAGARYTKDDKDVYVLRENFLGLGSPTFGNDAAFSLGAVTDYTNDRSFSEVTPRFGINYSPNDDTLTYFAYNRGFKSGGFDMRGNAQAAPLTKEGYDSEIVDAFEFGMKTMIGSRTRLNTAVFFSDYQDIQVTTQFAIDSDGDGVDDTFQSLLRNAGNAEMKGIEMELFSQATDKLGINFNVGYTDAEFVDFPGFDLEGNPIDLSDSKDIPHTPDWTGNLGFNYAMRTGETGLFTALVNVSYRGAYQIFEDALPLLDPDSATLLNAGLVWTIMDGRLTLSLQGRNLTDETYKVGGYNFPTLGPPGGSTLSFFGDPTTVTFTAAYTF